MELDLAPAVTASIIDTGIHDKNALLQRRAYVKSLRPTSPIEIKEFVKERCELLRQLREFDNQCIKVKQLHRYPGYFKCIRTYKDWRKNVNAVFSSVYEIGVFLDVEDMGQTDVANLSYYALEAAALFIRGHLDYTLHSVVVNCCLDDPIEMILRLDDYFLGRPVPRGIMNEFHNLKRRRNESLYDFQWRVKWFISKNNINVKENTMNRHFYEDLISTSP